MGFTAEQAEKFRQSILEEQREARKETVASIVARSLSIDEVYARFLDVIRRYPDEQYIGVYVLDTITNDWNDPNRKKVLADVKAQLTKKYDEAFPDADLEEGHSGSGNQGMAFRLTMKLG